MFLTFAYTLTSYPPGYALFSEKVSFFTCIHDTNKFYMVDESWGERCMITNFIFLRFRTSFNFLQKHLLFNLATRKSTSPPFLRNCSAQRRLKKRPRRYIQEKQSGLLTTPLYAIMYIAGDRFSAPLGASILSIVVKGGCCNHYMYHELCFI